MVHSNGLTLEQRIKCHAGLLIGRSLVTFTTCRNGAVLERKALVEIEGIGGKVWALPEPLPTQLYTVWQRVKGDMMVSGEGAVVVWNRPAAAQLRKAFADTPLAVIKLD